MRDELEIPMPRMAPAEPGYRIRPREPGDATTRRLAIIGAAIGAVLVGIVGVYGLTGRHGGGGGGGVPVVQADTRPLRSKPENRGGMQLSGQDDAILSGESGGQDALAPPPEQPAPQGLQDQARRELAAAQPAPPSVPTPTAPPPAPATPLPAKAASLGAEVPPHASVPIAAMPETKPAHAAPAKAPPTSVGQLPSAVPSALGGHTLVQLGALDSEAAALSEWQRLSHRMPGLLAGRQPSVQRTDQSGKTYYRLRTGGFVDIAEATAFCQQVRAQGGGCSLARF